MNFHSLPIVSIVVMAFIFEACIPARSEKHRADISLIVMTYNIHHANPPSKAEGGDIDLQAIANVINKAGPDLVALQEVDVNNTRSGIHLNEAKALAELTGMHYYFTRAMYFREGEYGNAVLSRYPIVDSASYLLSSEDSNSNVETRALCMVKVALSNNEEIYFASTHLDHHKDSTNRIKQVYKLGDILKELSLPVIIGGDFNAVPGSKTIQLLDSMFVRSSMGVPPFTFPAGNPNRTLDYIFYKPKDKIEVLDVKTLPENYASDHLPLIVTVQLEQP